ncbi:MAG: carbohydrate ABC transporter permease [Actinobacteria bacterium]|nr:carbohydrate ABC transporter permease [Actinomycetota bacterium]
MDHKRAPLNRFLWVLGTIVVVLYALVPVAWLVSLSLKPADELSNGKFLPRSPTLDNYTGAKGVFNDPQFPSALRNSVGIALIATVLAVTLAMFAAYAIVRLDFPGKQFVLGGALAIAMFPPVSIIGPLFNMWRSLRLFDTWPGLIIPYMTFTLPLAIWTLSAFFREIPWDLDKAARVDGATPFQAFRRIIAPLAAPGVFTSAILVFIFAWNDFLFATSLTSTNRARTVPAAIAFFTGSSQFDFPAGQIAAGSVVVTIPIILMVLVFQRRIVAGLTSGAVKG